jgi:hypothetical protein
MKKIVFIGLLLALGLARGSPARAQVFQLEQLVLDIEKLAQLKAILKDLKDGYQVLDKGYSVIRDISKGSFDLHKAFLDGLLLVSPEVRNDKRAADIIAMEISMVASYRQAWSRFVQDRHFGPEELDMLAQVYGNLMDRSAKALDDLLVVLTDGELRASDAERLKQIDKIYADLLGANGFLMQVNNSTALLSLQRAADENDAETTKKLYGIQ